MMNNLFKLIMYGIVLAGLTVGFCACSDSDSNSKPVTTDPGTDTPDPGTDTPDPGTGDVSFGVGDYPNANLLVSGGALEAGLSESADFVLIDARGGSLPAPGDSDYGKHPYIQGHIPGAISLSYEEFGTPLNPVSELETILTGKGITRDMTIIIYDDTTASWGAAGRLFWMLEYLGCEDVHILHGGWDLWVADGRTTESEVNTLPAAEAFVTQINTDILATKEHVRDRLEDDDFVLIDSRTDEEFNGWTLYGEARGGHISGAVQIPYEWFYYDNKTVLMYEDLQELFENRGITSDKEVASYCTAGVRSGFVYFALRLLGYTNCSNYDGSIYEWADASVADPGTYPMEQMANYEKLVYPAWVDELIANGNPGVAGTPATYNGNGYIIVEANGLYWGATPGDNYDRYYEEGHIPGAISIPLDALETNAPGGIYPLTCPDDDNLLPPAELQEVLESYGISYDKTVIVYWNAHGYSTGGWRVAWALLCAGVEDVRVMNGSLDAWTAYGGTLETEANTPSPVSFGKPAPDEHPSYLTTTEDVEAMISDSNSVIVDIRRWIEHTSTERAGYLFFSEDGHIPNAVYGENSSWYPDDDNTLRSYTEILDMWTERGITPDKNITFHCGTGWRSSMTFWCAYLLGYPNVGNYDAGWYGWTWDPSHPRVLIVDE